MGRLVASAAKELTLGANIGASWFSSMPASRQVLPYNSPLSSTLQQQFWSSCLSISSLLKALKEIGKEADH